MSRPVSEISVAGLAALNGHDEVLDRNDYHQKCTRRTHRWFAEKGWEVWEISASGRARAVTLRRAQGRSPLLKGAQTRSRSPGPAASLRKLDRGGVNIMGSYPMSAPPNKMAGKRAYVG